MHVRKAISVCAIFLAACFGSSIATAQQPRVSRVCAENVDLARSRAVFRTEVDWGTAKRSDYYRFDVVARDGTGGYYPQFRDQNSGPGLPDRGFIETASIYPLTFYVVGMTRPAAMAFDAACRKDIGGCKLDLSAPGVTLFQDSSIAVASRNLAGDCQRGANLSALVIGVDDYPPTSPGNGTRGITLRALANPVADANAIGTGLTRLGYQVAMRANIKRSDLLNTLSTLKRDTSSGPHKLIVYFAGHGVALGEQSYLMPIDAATLMQQPGSGTDPVADLTRSAVTLNELISQLPPAGRGFNLIVLDMCRDDPSGGTLPGPDLVKLPPNTVVVYATSAGQTSIDGRTSNGPLAAALIARLTDPGRNLFDVLREVGNEIRADTSDGKKGPQYMRIYGQADIGDACFGPCPR